MKKVSLLHWKWSQMKLSKYIISYWAWPLAQTCLCFNTHRPNLWFILQQCWADISYSSSTCSMMGRHGFEFRDVILLCWLLTMVRESSLLCYLTHKWRGNDGTLPFPMIFVWKWMEWSQLKFEHSAPISIFKPLTILPPAHQETFVHTILT